jgi:hypothetical protein
VASGPIVPRFLVQSRIGSSAATSSARLAPMFARRAGDYPIDVTDSDMSTMNFNGVGGGTIIPAGVCARADRRPRSAGQSGDA